MEDNRRPKVPVANSHWVYVIPGVGEVGGAVVDDCIVRANGHGLDLRRICIESAPMPNEAPIARELRQRLTARAVRLWRDDL